MQLLSNHKVLLIANSGRMLAQSARKSGLIPLVIDRYGDQDTQDLADEIHPVKSFELQVLLPLIKDIQNRRGVQWLILGSGLEKHYAQLSCNLEPLEIIGNSLETMEKLVNKQLFFKHLENLSIDFPKVRFIPPPKPTGWLAKSYFSEGGLGVKRANNKNAFTPGLYWQKQITGRPVSALFLGDRQHNVKIIGYQTQWTTTLNNDQPFLFKGVINHTSLTVAEKAKILLWVQQLTTHFSLIGLNSLDLIANDGGLKILEINPRPSASLNLYDDDFPAGLLQQHFASCKQSLTDYSYPIAKQVRAYQILYADNAIRVPFDISWPAGCADIPKPDSLIGKYQPICSIIAAGKSSTNIKKILIQKTNQILAQLTKRNE